MMAGYDHARRHPTITCNNLRTVEAADSTTSTHELNEAKRIFRDVGRRDFNYKPENAGNRDRTRRTFNVLGF